MSWLALLLSLASLGGNPAPADFKPTVKQCNKLSSPAKKKACKKVAKAKPRKPAKPRPRSAPGPDRPAAPRDDTPSTAPTHRDPDATPTPTPTPKPGATPTPTPGPVYPSRTGVDLTDTDVWSVRVTYRTLAAGRIEFVTTNVGEDDHDLSVRQGTTILGKLPLAPGETETLALTLAAGSYTLFCSLPDHEVAGMRANISVR